MRRYAVLIAGLLWLSVRAASADAFVGYTIVPAFSNLTFYSPVALASPPGETNRLFILEKNGRVTVITNLAAPNRTVFMALTNKLDTSSECGLVGLAFHPNYAVNGYFYLFFTPTNSGGTRFDRVSRFQTDPTNPNAGLPGSEQIILSQLDQAPNHQGADIHFGPDGYLYVPLGDEGGANDQYANSQRINKDFFSGILRIDVDKRPGNLRPNPHPAVTTNYLVPADNPFVGATSFNGQAVNPTQVRTEFWAVGLRNPWRISFDEATGLLYCGDVGQNTREEIDIITKGGNYGWNYREGTIARPGSPAPPAGFSSINPILDYAHGTGTNRGDCVIGGVVYRGQKLTRLIGSYVFCDFVDGNFWTLNYQGASPVTSSLIGYEPGVCAFGKDPRDGEILLASYTGNTIKKLVLKPDQSPTVRLLSPTNSFRITNGPVTFTGRASDDSQVTQVLYQVNGGDFQTANGTTNWTFTTDLAAGTNHIVIKALDDSGHESAPLAITRYFVVTNQLTVMINGTGLTTPNYNGKFLEIGRWYTNRAMPGTRFVFTNWSGGVSATNATLAFFMQSNLVIQANFITNPFLAVRGIYNGLFLPTNAVASDNAGFINVILTGAGGYTGTLKVDGIAYSLSGSFSLDGISRLSVPRFGKSTLQLSLQLNLGAPNDSLQGAVGDANWSANILAYRQVYSATTNPATTWAGQYTLLLPPDTNGPPDLRGFGYGLGTISLGGNLTLNGSLADGGNISQTVPVSQNGQCPIYVPLYPDQAWLTNISVIGLRAENKGFLLGWLSVSNAPDSIMTGNLNWVKKSWTNALWPSGFTNILAVAGSRFHPPGKGSRVMNFTNFSATVSGGSLPSSLTASLLLATNNKISFISSNIPSFSLQLNLTNGAVSGRFSDANAGTNAIKGALLQQQNYGAGFFIGTNSPGVFQLQAQ